MAKFNTKKEVGQVFTSDITATLEESFLNYSAFVLQRRALPDARDGFKYTARQILHAQHREKLTYNKPLKKSQKSVAAATAFSYVHGDTSAYGQLIRMGRPLVQRYFLEEIQGNGGTPTASDTYSAARYTECRGTELTHSLFNGIEKNTLAAGDWSPTYDEEGMFPLVLPSLGFYNLVNGSFGSIGVGIVSSIPQFNLTEMNNAIIGLINDPSYTPSLLPDFASGGILMNPQTTLKSLAKGEGKSALLRGEIVKDAKAGTVDIVSLPYGVYTDTVCLEIQKKQDESPITDFKDLTTQKVFIRIYTKNVDATEEWLYQNTSVQKHYTVKMNMLKDGKVPHLFNMKTALQAHIDHAGGVLRAALTHDAGVLQNRIKVIEGLLRAYDIIDEVIALIKSSSGRADAVAQLQIQFNFFKIQAEAIADLRLHRLSSIDITALKSEMEEAAKELENINELLTVKEKFNLHLIGFYEEITRKFGDSRRTKIYEFDNYELEQDGGKVKEKFVLTFDEGSYKVVTVRECGPVKDMGLSTFEPDDDLIIVTSQTRCFLRKGGDLTLGQAKWIETVKLNQGEKVLMVVNKALHPAIKSFKVVDSHNGISYKHPSFITVSASARGKRFLPGKVEISSVRPELECTSL